MTAPGTRRAHLVERAFQAMGGAPAALDAATAVGAGDTAVADRPAASGHAAEGGTTILPPPPRAASPTSAAVGTTVGSPVNVHGAAPKPVITPPTLEVMQKAGLVNLPGGALRTRLAEEFSVVHHQLLRTIRTMDKPTEGSGRGRRVVLVTSARPGEGKSFCSLNLAVSIAHGRSASVLLVDADGKRGSLSELLGLGEAPGLRLLASDSSQPPAPLIVPTEQRNFSILPYGTPVPGQPEVPAGTTVAAAVQRLAAMLPQHVIILDAPPCLSTSDPSSLAPVVGQVLVVVHAEKTQRAEVEAALDMVEACPVLQLMLNQTRQNSADTFGAYGAYGGYGVYGTYGPKSETSG